MCEFALILLSTTKAEKCLFVKKLGNFPHLLCFYILHTNISWEEFSQIPHFSHHLQNLIHFKIKLPELHLKIETSLFGKILFIIFLSLSKKKTTKKIFSGYC